jgi:arylsulfatase A-like enzyme
MQTGRNQVVLVVLKKMRKACALKSGMLILFCCLVALVSQGQLNHRKPNIIIIIADDLGWADLSCYGSTFYETPHLDGLARKGTRFTQAYATSPVCSPTRSSLMTGKYPVKTGVTDWIRGRQENGKAMPYEKMIGSATAYQLSLSENTLAEQLKKRGYQTFFAGKWHLGEEEPYWPEYQGFDTNKGGWSKGGPTGKKNDSTGGYFTPYQNPRLPDGPPGEYLTDRLTDECLRFLEAEHQSPFLMVYSLYAVHNPLQAPAALVKKYQEKRKGILQPGQSAFVKDEPWMQYEKGWQRRVVQDNPVYAAMIENIDSNIGRILAKLEALKIADNTIILFTSDNGGLSTAEGSPTANGPLRAGKGWLYEGGLRVPFIMYGPGVMQEQHTTAIPVTTADIFPTLAAMENKNHRPDPLMDGADILQLLKDTASAINRTLYWHYPHYSNQGGRPGAAIREGAWKLIYNYENDSIQLYNLSNDMSERNNLASMQPEKAAVMKQKLMQWLQVNKASAPIPNKDYKGETQ